MGDQLSINYIRVVDLLVFDRSQFKPTLHALPNAENPIWDCNSARFVYTHSPAVYSSLASCN